MYDVIGNIAVVQKRDKKLAKWIMDKNHHISAVYFRGKISGRLRIPKLSWIAGKKIYETVHKESGCFFKLDIRKCFFSPRMSTDRADIAKKVKKNESVLVMFSGIAPYPIVISKKSKAKQIYCIELGKEVVKYANENIKMNKVNNVVVIQGDVRDIVPTMNKKFDRIVMSRPQLKETFLKEAFLVAKKGTIIHYYDFALKSKMHETIDVVENYAKKANKKIRIIDFKPIREIAPYKYNTRLDLMVLR